MNYVLGIEKTGKGPIPKTAGEQMPLSSNKGRKTAQGTKISQFDVLLGGILRLLNNISVSHG